MKSKLTPHVLVPNSGSPLLVKAGCPLIKSVGDMGILLEAQQINPGIVCIGRFDNPRLTAEQLRAQFPARPDLAAETWVNTYKDLWSLNKHVTYIELPNEPVFKNDNNTDDIDGLLWLDQFMTRCVLLMASLGLRAVGPNFSTGYPDIGSLVAVMPFLKVLKEHKGIFALHGYSIGRPIDSNHECFRHELIYNQVLLPNGLKNLPIAYTEWGVVEYKIDIIRDGVLIRPALSDDEYASQLIEADSRLRSFPGNLLGATIYTFGSNNTAWDNYNVGNDGNRVPSILADHIRNTNDDPIPPQPPVSGKFKVGDTVETTVDGLRVRSTPVIRTDGVPNIVGIHKSGTTAKVLDGPALGSGLLWWLLVYSDVTGWSAESQNGVEYLKLHTPDPIPEPVPDPVSENLLLNSSFEDGYYLWHSVKELATPNHWDYWYQGDVNLRLDRQDTPFFPPEGVVWNKNNAPEHEKEIFFLDGQFCLKEFKGWGPIWFRLSQTVNNLKVGKRYRFTVPIFPDLVMRYDNGNKVWADDPLAGEVLLGISDHSLTGNERWVNGNDFPFGKYTNHILEFVAERSTHELSIDCRGRWGLIENGFFLDKLELREI